VSQNSRIAIYKPNIKFAKQFAPGNKLPGNGLVEPTTKRYNLYVCREFLVDRLIRTTGYMVLAKNGDFQLRLRKESLVKTFAIIRQDIRQDCDPDLLHYAPSPNFLLAAGNVLLSLLP
jgi:hypothetical protein